MIRSATFALFTRSLREDSRKPTPFFARMGLAAVILLFLGFAHATYSLTMGMGATPGLTFFGFVIWINAVFFTVVGLAHFASAITEEKEEMTLGLLRMTNLNPLSILLGKSTNRLFVALMYLGAQFPFTLLAVSLGGVAMDQLIAAYVALAAYVVLLANVALFFSVICRRTFAAAFMSVLAIAGYFVFAWASYGIASLLEDGGVIATDGLLIRIPRSLAETTIMWRLGEVFETGFMEGPLCLQVLANTGAAILLFGLSWIIFNAFTRNQLNDDGGAARPVGTMKSKRSHKEGRKLFTPDRPGSSRALFWKDWHFLHYGRLGMLIRFGLLGCLFFFIVPALSILFNYSPRRRFDLDRLLLDLDEFGAWMFFLSAVVLVLQLCLHAGKIFRDEIRWKTLSSIAMLPMSMTRIAYQKVGAALITVLPMLCFMMLGLVLASEEILDDLGRFDAEELFYFFTAVFYIVAQVFMGVHIIAILSLYLKWGSFALGLFLVFIFNMAFFMFAALSSIGSSDGFFGLLFLASLGASAVGCVLHAMIGKGLEAAAAKE